MANSLLTINMITREALRLFRNTNSFLQKVDRQYDDAFARVGAKIGNTLRIRLPNDYVLRTGPTAVAQDTVENFTSLTIATQVGVDISFSTADRALSLDDYSRRVLAPAINVLVGGIAADVISGIEGGSSAFVANLSGANVISPTATTWLAANAILDMAGAPTGNRRVVMDFLTQSRTIASLTGLFNPQQKIGQQYNSADMAQNSLGFRDWSADQTMPLHTTGAYGAGGTVAGANQTGTSITTSALGGPLNKGDIITFAGVFAVNRITKASTGVLQQFVVTANVAGGATSIPIYPALIPQAAGPVNVRYQTVLASPAAGAVIAVVTPAGSQYRTNLAFIPEAVTMVTADLELPRGVHEAARESYDGMSIRIISDYIPTTDQVLTRMDVLYGYAWLRPEWIVKVADVV